MYFSIKSFVHFIESYVKITGPRTIEGFRRSEAWAKEQHVYFIIKFSKPFKKMEYSVKRKFQTSLNNKEQAEGAYFEFNVNLDIGPMNAGPGDAAEAVTGREDTRKVLSPINCL